MRKPLVMGIGEILWDMLPGGKQLGGAPANFAFHARQLGADSQVASCVGRDDLGAQVLDRLRGLGMPAEHVAVDPAHPTGTVDVALDAAGVPTFTIHENTAWDHIPATRKLMELADRADAICFGSLAQRSAVSGQTIREIVARTEDHCLRVFDINLRQHYFSRETIHTSLLLCDVLKLNDQELPVLVEMMGLASDEKGAMAGLMERYPLKLAALTRGGAGSRLYDPAGQIFEHPGHKTDIVDTVGAGDAFTAALTMGLLAGQNLTTINERANRLAAYVCSQAGGTPAHPAGLLD